MDGLVLCIGGATVDRLYRAADELVPGTSNPVVSSRAFGGVARNVAETLARLGTPVALVSVVGADENGRAIRDHLAVLGVDVGFLREIPGARTAEYVAVTGPSGDLAFGLADMAILDRLGPGTVEDARCATAALMVMDCNLPASTLREFLARRRAGHGPPVAVDAVSVAKVMRLPKQLGGVDVLFLNLDEARAALGATLPAEDAVGALLARGARAVVLTRGPSGLLVADERGVEAMPAVPVGAVADVTGAGDALVGATAMGLARGEDLRVALRAGLAAAALALERPGGVRPDLGPALLAAGIKQMP
ncbi:carbohydrate kinase family protein [Salinarimonas soli]|uniref:carbohydrate kinase family protein n=1 Tax=Salinarimonas soli TaxID=1638099 RepID=UPI001661E2F6|nr:carbohydrate kinase family protein [Salinarimonas soli]